jgi:hypothetical protein
MYSALTKNTLEKIYIIKDFVTIHQSIIAAQQEASKRQRMNIYAVSSCVTHLYAIFENFIETSISDYLDVIPELVSYQELSNELKNDYRIGISHVLSKIDNERYSHLTHENIVKWYHEALINSESYRFVTEALTRHDQNFRLHVIDSLFSRMQMKDLRSWLTHHAEIQSLYTENISIYEQLESELRDFIQLRNDASHGGLELDELVGEDNLQRYCHLIEKLVLALSSYLHKCLLLKQYDAGKAKKVGVVSEVFGKNGAFIAQVINETSLSLGSSIHFVGSNYCFSQEILSLRIDDIDVEHLVSERDGHEVGVKCLNQVKKRADIYINT